MEEKQEKREKRFGKKVDEFGKLQKKRVIQGKKNSPFKKENCGRKISNGKITS